MMDEVDLDKSGAIDLEEFCQLMSARAASAPRLLARRPMANLSAARPRARAQSRG